MDSAGLAALVTALGGFALGAAGLYRSRRTESLAVEAEEHAAGLVELRASMVEQRALLAEYRTEHARDRQQIGGLVARVKVVEKAEADCQRRLRLAEKRIAKDGG